MQGRLIKPYNKVSYDGKEDLWDVFSCCWVGRQAWSIQVELTPKDLSELTEKEMEKVAEAVTGALEYASRADRQTTIQE